MKKSLIKFISLGLALSLCSATSFAQESLETETLTAAPGASFYTAGWADNAKIKYSKEKITVIDDKTYPDPIAKAKALVSAAGSISAKFIVISGEVDLSMGKVTDSDHSYFDEFNSDGSRKHNDFAYPLTSNKTLIGVDGAKIKFGGFVIKNAKNVIIRNITFWDAHGSTEVDTKVKSESKASADALGFEKCDNVWVDHCTFTDGTCIDLKRNYNHDGQLDVKSGNNITVSYCEFTNHDKVMLIRNGDKLTNPEECSITLHHNYFHGAIQRMPRSRGVKMHIYNNYYDKIGNSENTGSSLGPGIGSLYVVENNFFGEHAGTIVKYYDKSDAKAKTFSKFFHKGNLPELTDKNCSYDKVDKLKAFKKHVVNEKPFAIPYTYALEEAATLKDTVPALVGSGKPIKIEGYN